MDTIQYPVVSKLVDDMNLDELDRKIYNFVLKHKDCSENKIRNSGICSQKWARIKLWGLVKKEYLEDFRTGKKGFHRFRVSDRTNFTKIDNVLETIESQINVMGKPLLRIAEIQDSGNWAEVAAYSQKFVEPYFRLMVAKLFRLRKLSNTNTDIGKEDKLILQTKIISLIAKVTQEPFYDLNYQDILSQNKNLLNKFMEDLSKPGASKTVFGIHELRSLHNFVNNIDRFEELVDKLN